MLKHPFIVAIIFFLLLPAAVSAQEDDSSSSSMNANKYIFTDQERDSLQLWFYDRATVMGLEDEKRDEFYNIVLNYAGKARALRKKELEYSSGQEQEKFEQLLKKQHEEVRAILDDKQYTYYLDTYNKLLKSVYKRNGWE